MPCHSTPPHPIPSHPPMPTYRDASLLEPHVLVSDCRRTTCCAFVATAFSSPIPTLKNFGIFAAVVIILDYVLVMTFLCASVVVYHNYFENKPGFCCACCVVASPGSACDWWLCSPAKLGGCEVICSGQKETTTQKALAGGPETEQAAKPLYIRLFEDKFPFELVIKNKGTRAFSILIFLGILIPSIIGVTKVWCCGQNLHTHTCSLPLPLTPIRISISISIPTPISTHTHIHTQHTHTHTYTPTHPPTPTLTPTPHENHTT